MLHQIALFENPAIKNAVVLSEVYYRIKALCTNATKNFFVFYSENHRDAYVEILLITNNRESKKNAIEEGLSSEIEESYVRSLQQPNLPDLVAIPTSLNILKGELNDLRLSKREVIYPEHKLASEITSGLLHGIYYHKGRFRVNRYNPLVSYVRSRSIANMVNIKKVFGGDIVAAELLCPQFQRTEENSLIVEDVNGNVDDAQRNANIAKAWAGSRPNVSSCSFGRVIGIIKRNWSSTPKTIYTILILDGRRN